MKIAILTQGFRPHVAEASNITIRLLAEELVKQKHEVFIFCNQIFKQPLKETYKGIKIIRTPAKYAKTIQYNLQNISISKIFKEEASKGEFDVIHNFSSSPLLSIKGLLARKYSKNARLIQTIKAKTAYKTTNILTPLLNKYDVVTVSTDFLKKRLIKFGLKGEKIKTVTSYIDTLKFKPRDKTKLKKKYKLKGKVLLYYGHLSEAKGISYLLDAIESLRNEKITFLFVTGSTDPYVGPYKAEIKARKLNIKLIRTTKNIEEYVSLADAVVLPYPNLISTEAQPSCILETMASKTPLITTRLEELKELVSEDEVVFANPADSKDLAEKIKETLKKSDKNITKAYNKALKFDFRKVVKDFVKLYRS